jgi:hypothetical protein
MATNIKIAICYAALIISALFLIICVDYLPYLVCWLPLIIVGYAVAQCKEFKENFNKVVDNIIP